MKDAVYDPKRARIVYPTGYVCGECGARARKGTLKHAWDCPNESWNKIFWGAGPHLFCRMSRVRGAELVGKDNFRRFTQGPLNSSSTFCVVCYYSALPNTARALYIKGVPRGYAHGTCVTEATRKVQREQERGSKLHRVRQEAVNATVDDGGSGDNRGRGGSRKKVVPKS